MIYIVSFFYAPITNPAGNRMSLLAEALVDRFGAEEVTVITGRLHFPEGRLPDHLKGTFFFKSRGQYGEQVINLYDYATPFNGVLKKTFGMLTFSFSVGLYFLFRRMRGEDLIVTTTGPIFHALTLTFLSFVKRRFRYVVDLRDLWPEQLAAIGFLKEGSLPYRGLMSLSRMMYARAETVVVNAPGFSAHLPPLKNGRESTLLVNPVDLTQYVPMEEEGRAEIRRAYPAIFEGRKVFLFHGAHTTYSGLMVLMEALRGLKEVREGWRFLFVGDGDLRDEMMSYSEEYGLQECVSFLPWQSRSKILAFIAAADFGFSSVTEWPIYDNVFPTKVAEFLACDKAVVAAVPALCEDYFSLEKVGYLAARGDSEALLGALMQALDQEGALFEAGTARAVVEAKASAKVFRCEYGELMAALLES